VSGEELHGHAPDGQGIFASEAAEAVEAAVAIRIIVPVIRSKPTLAQQLIDMLSLGRVQPVRLGSSDGKRMDALDTDFKRAHFPPGPLHSAA
jgi:hypothetical protein